MASSKNYAALFCVVAVGCSYQSTYVPPMDGRARPVWHKNTVLAHLGRDAGPACAQAVVELATGKPWAVHAMQEWQHRSRASVGPAVGFVMFWPWVLAPVPVPVPLVYPGTRAFWDSLSSLFLVAVVVLPFVDIGIAVDRPEDGKTSAAAIDAVNAYNDLARSEGNPCSYGAP